MTELRDDAPWGPPAQHGQSGSRDEPPLAPPPTYDDSSPPPPGRFGRWSNWIEKRGAERREEREELKRTGRLGPSSSWDLPDSFNSATVSAGPSAGSSIDGDLSAEVDELRRNRNRDEAAEKRMSGSSFTIANPDLLEHALPEQPATAAGRARASSSPSTHSTTSPGVQRLTKNLSLEQLGSRFDRGLPERPLCAMALPTQARMRGRPREEDRFLLVGTAGGLYLADLAPSLSSGGPLLRAPSHAVSPARILPLWTNLGVYDLSHVLEPSTSSSTAARGLVVALVGGSGDHAPKEVRMWSLGGIVSLANWRIFNEASLPTASPLHLSPLSNSHLSPSPATSPSHARKSSFGVFKSILSPSPSPKSSAKQAEARSRQTSGDSGLVGERDGSATSRSSEHDQLPYEWANSFVRLPLPRGHAPILFIDISRMPHRYDPAAASSSNSYLFPPRDRAPSSSSSDSDSDIADYTNEQQRKKAIRQDEEQRLFLSVVTSRVVFVFESRSRQERKWVLTRELTAPSSPRFLRLVRSPLQPSQSRSDSVTSRTTNASPHSRSATAETDAVYPPDLCLFLGLAHRGVLIRLSDYSVQEVEAPHSTHATSPTHGHSLSLSRPRTKSLSNSIRSTASSSHQHSRSPSSNLLDKVSKLVEGRGSLVPVGLRGEKGIVLGKKLGTGDLSSSRVSLDDGGTGSESGHDHDEPTLTKGKGAKWIGISELDVRSAERANRFEAKFYLLSKGHSTYLVRAPLESGSGTSDAPSDGCDKANAPSSIVESSLHTFRWAPDLEIDKVVHFLLQASSQTAAPDPRPLLVLVAFTPSGLSVQQGRLSLEAVKASLDPAFVPTAQVPLFVPTPETPLLPATSSLSPTRRGSPNASHPALCAGSSTGDEEEQDLSGTAMLDFGRDAGWLCPSLRGDDSEQRGELGAKQSGYLFKKTHSDYVVLQVSVRP
ncbi:hypothetical protein JCM10212_007030 [Sporobolomyces blumeae]